MKKDREQESERRRWIRDIRGKMGKDSVVGKKEEVKEREEKGVQNTI